MITIRISRRAVLIALFVWLALLAVSVVLMNVGFSTSGPTQIGQPVPQPSGHP